MSKMKKLALSLLLAMPMVASAAGMGVYIPFGVANSSSVEGDYYTATIDKDYEAAAGFGLAFDSNIGKDKLFNYRLGVEYMTVGVDNVNGYSTSQEYSRFNFVNTFGFGVLRTEKVRLWVGPRVNVAWNWTDQSLDGSSNYGHSEVALELGVAPAVGINVHLSRVVSLSFDLDYRVAYISGAWTNDYNDDTYTGTTTGPAFRAYVLFKFGEEFQKPAPQSADQGVIDQSL